MKNLYYAALVTGILLVLFALGGGTIFKSPVTSLSQYSLEKSGVKIGYVNQVDDKIDDILYQVKRIQYQVDRVKSFFSENKPDESNYKREQNKIIESTVYTPLVDVTSFFIRVFFFLTGCMMLMLAVIIYLIRKFNGLFKRVRHMENQLHIKHSY
jgi:hypothetical protein